MRLLWLVLLFLLFSSFSYADEWTSTAYCSCTKCCGKNAKGIMANGERVHSGAVATNILPLGTVVLVTDNTGSKKVYVVKDRGANYIKKKVRGKTITTPLFKNAKRLDIFFHSHEEALKYGKKTVNVEILVV